MSPNKNTLAIIAIVFLAFCIFKTIQVFFSSLNVDIRKTILSYLLIYGSCISAFEIYKGRNEPNYGVSVGSGIGATLGAIAGFYVGYQICIFINILNSENLIESSSISVAVAWTSAEICRQIGSYFGSILLHI